MTKTNALEALVIAGFVRGLSVRGHGSGLGERGLACPLLVISDGSAGLIGAAERTMPSALRQRCLVHRARNILAKVPRNAQAQVKADYWEIFEVPDKIAPGEEAVKLVQDRVDAFAPPLATPTRRGPLPAHRPRLADRLPAVPPRALDPPTVAG